MKKPGLTHILITLMVGSFVQQLIAQRDISVIVMETTMRSQGDSSVMYEFSGTGFSSENITIDSSGLPAMVVVQFKNGRFAKTAAPENLEKPGMITQVTIDKGKEAVSCRFGLESDTRLGPAPNIDSKGFILTFVKTPAPSDNDWQVLDKPPPDTVAADSATQDSAQAAIVPAAPADSGVTDSTAAAPLHRDFKLVWMRDNPEAPGFGLLFNDTIGKRVQVDSGDVENQILIRFVDIELDSQVQYKEFEKDPLTKIDLLTDSTFIEGLKIQTMSLEFNSKKWKLDSLHTGQKSILLHFAQPAKEGKTAAAAQDKGMMPFPFNKFHLNDKNAKILLYGVVPATFGLGFLIAALAGGGDEPPPSSSTPPSGTGSEAAIPGPGEPGGPPAEPSPRSVGIKGYLITVYYQ